MNPSVSFPKDEKDANQVIHLNALALFLLRCDVVSVAVMDGGSSDVDNHRH